MVDEHFENFKKHFRPKFNNEDDVRIYGELKKIDKIIKNKKLSKASRETIDRSKQIIVYVLKHRKK